MPKSTSFNRSFLITGASGQLGAYLLRELARGKSLLQAWSGSSEAELFGIPLRCIDLTDKTKVTTAFREANPSIVIHTAAISNADRCLLDEGRAWKTNVQGTQTLLELAEGAGARFVFVSTDWVFDGERGRYREHDATAPATLYGRTKVIAEQAVLTSRRGAIIRFGPLFGPSLNGRKSSFDEQLAAFREKKSCGFFEDEWRTPLSLAIAAKGLLEIAKSEFTGILHMGGPERLSRLELGKRIAHHIGRSTALCTSGKRATKRAREPRPRDTSLDSALWRKLFPEYAGIGLEESLSQMGI